MEMYDYIGDNAPNYRIELSAGDNFKEHLIEKQYNDNINTAMPVKMGDDYIIASINNNGFLQLDIFKTDKFLYGDFEPDEIIIYNDIKGNKFQVIPIINVSGHEQCIESTVLDSGELQIYINKLEENGDSGAYCIAGFDYNNLQLKSVIFEKKLSNIFPTTQKFGTTRVYKTRVGNIVIGVEGTFEFGTGYAGQLHVYASEDKGNTWYFKNAYGGAFGWSTIYHVNGIFEHNNKGYMILTTHTTANRIVEIDNKGEFIKDVYEDGGHFFRYLFTYENINNTQLIVAGESNFKFYNSKKNETFLDIAMYAYATELDLPDLKQNYFLESTKINNKIVIKTGMSKTFFTVIEPLKTAINQDVIDITIDRPKNMIGSATIKLNNYMGKYAPDGEINPYKLFPNKEIIIYLGYGKDLKKAFTGYIDSIQMDSFPHIITLQCRDTLKLCKDQLLYYNNKYTHKFTKRTPENLFRILCNAAGVKYGTVEKTGIRLAEVEWNYVSVYDCMEEIAELSGFELSCDENGVLHFREEKPKKNQPVVKSFKEGKNITTLDYSIDDSELYHSVIAQGKKEKEITVKNKKGKRVKKKVEEVISYRGYWGPRNFYNLPKNKILVVDASEADNKTDLKKVVDQALYLMTCRARQVSFEAIADTSLKVGDMIRVEESGSTISEIYRITGIGFDLNNSGYTMTIECYHHRNIKPEDKEE